MQQTYTGTLTVIECCNCHMDFGLDYAPDGLG